MKRAFLGGVTLMVMAGSAGATDLPAKAPVYKAAAPAVFQYDWTGFYAGVNWGTAIAQSTASTAGFLGSVDINQAGFTAGVQAGYNWQINPNWLVGLEGDIGYLGTDRIFADWNDPTLTVGVKTDWYGTVRGRFGYVTGPSVLYLTGGAAFVHLKDTFGGGAAVGPTTSSFTKSGWTLGGGIETKLSRNWSSKTEYLYIEVPNQSFAANPFGGADVATFLHSFHVIKTGLNYKFGGPAEALPFFSTAMLAPAHNWTGLYVGVNAGLGVSTTRVPAMPNTFGFIAGNTDMNGRGFAGGAQLGYNFMIGPQWLVGLEGDLGYLGLNHSFREWNDPGVTFAQKTDWYGTLRGRIGRTTGPALLYLTGGGAWVRIQDGITTVAAGEQTSRTGSGWTFGGGTEVALDPRWSARLEYLYIDAGRRTHTFGEFQNRFQVVRAGLNYSFNSDPVVTARY